MQEDEDDQPLALFISAGAVAEVTDDFVQQLLTGFVRENLPWHPRLGAARKALFSITDHLEVAFLPALMRTLQNREKQTVASHLIPTMLDAEADEDWKSWYKMIQSTYAHKVEKQKSLGDELLRAKKEWKHEKRNSILTDLRRFCPETPQGLSDSAEPWVQVSQGMPEVFYREIDVPSKGSRYSCQIRAEIDRILHNELSSAVIRIFDRIPEDGDLAQVTLGVIILLPPGLEKKAFQAEIEVQRKKEAEEQQPNRPMRLVLKGVGKCEGKMRSMQRTFDDLHSIDCTSVKGTVVEEFKKPDIGLSLQPDSIQRVSIHSINDMNPAEFSRECQLQCAEFEGGTSTLQDVLRASRVLLDNPATAGREEASNTETDITNLTCIELHIAVQNVTDVSGEAVSSEAKQEAATETASLEQQEVAGRLLNRVKWVLERRFSQKLEGFEGLKYLILVPSFNTLLEQTLLRAHKYLDGNMDIEDFRSTHRVTTCQLGQHQGKKKLVPAHFIHFTAEVNTNPNSLFVLVVDESHWGPGLGGAQDTLINHETLMRPNVIVLQVSATPYCNLTRNSRIPERYAKFKDGDVIDESDRADHDNGFSEEVNVVHWFPPNTNESGAHAHCTTYVRLEDFLRTMPSKLRHEAVSRSVGQGEGAEPEIEPPISSRLLRADPRLQERMKKPGAGAFLPGAREYAWLMDVAFSMVYFSKHWDAEAQELRTSSSLDAAAGDRYQRVWTEFHALVKDALDWVEKGEIEKQEANERRARERRAQGKQPKRNTEDASASVNGDKWKEDIRKMKAGIQAARDELLCEIKTHVEREGDDQPLEDMSEDAITALFLKYKEEHHLQAEKPEPSCFTETDCIVRDLLSTYEATVSANDSEQVIKQGCMTVVRVHNNAFGYTLQRIVRFFRDTLFSRTAFSVIQDTGGTSLADSIEDQFKTVPMLRWKRDECGNEVASIATINDIVRNRKAPLQYSELHGLPCMLFVCAKGRMGDTFPKSFKCLDLRIRTSENTTTLVQELGRMSRYMDFNAGEHSETVFSDSALETVLAKFTEDGGRLRLGVFAFDEDRGSISKPKFVGLARSVEPWDSKECSCTVIQHCFLHNSLPKTRNAGSNPCEFQLAKAHPSSLVNCRIVKMTDYLKSPRKLHQDKHFVYRQVVEHVPGSPTVILNEPFPKELDESVFYAILQDQGCLRWLCEQNRLHGGVIRPLRDELPYALVTGQVMQQLEKAVDVADLYGDEIWRCVKIGTLDQYVQPINECTNSKRRILKIEKGKNEVHDYRCSYTATNGPGENVNLDSHRYCNELPDPHKPEDTGFVHHLRFQLAAECQIGKTGTYLHFIRLLREAISEGRVALPGLPEPPSDSDLLDLEHATIRKAYGYLLPYWEDISRRKQPWSLFEDKGIAGAKYHYRVKLQRLELLLQVLCDSSFKDKAWPVQASEFVRRLRSSTDECSLGEEVQSSALKQRVEDLENACRNFQGCPIESFRDANKLCFRVVNMGDLQRMVDWDCPARHKECSVFWYQAASNDDPFSFPKQGLIEKHPSTPNAFVLQRPLNSLSFDVQTLMWSSSSGSGTGGAAIGTRLHPFDARLITRQAAGQTQTLCKFRLAPHMHAGTSRPIDLRSIFGENELSWPLICMQKCHEDLFEFEHDSSAGLTNSERRIRRGVLQTPEEKCVRNWIFTPSFNRHLRSPKQALLDRSKALPLEAKAAQFLLVRASQFEDYCRDFGSMYVIVSLPATICRQNLFAQLSSVDHSTLKLRTQGVPSLATAEKGGIGYARLFAQVFAYLLQLSRVWLVDDNVVACDKLDVAAMFQSSPPRKQPLQPCSFADVMTSIEEQFGDLGDSAPLLRDPSSGALIDIGTEAQDGTKLLVSCPTSRIEGLRDAPRTERSPRLAELGAHAKVPSSRHCLSGDESAFGIIGIRRDPNLYKENHPPWSITHSVYSMYLLNVHSTVERGVFYSPRTFWEDIEFNQMCEENNLAVLKCNRFFHNKHWDSSGEHDRAAPSAAMKDITVCIVGGETWTFQVKEGLSSCKWVWPEVFRQLSDRHQGQGCKLKMLQAHGQGDSLSSKLPMLEAGTLDPSSDCIDKTFDNFQVLCVYELQPESVFVGLKDVDETFLDSSDGNTSLQTKSSTDELLGGWAGVNSVRTIFTCRQDKFFMEKGDCVTVFEAANVEQKPLQSLWSGEDPTSESLAVCLQCHHRQFIRAVSRYVMEELRPVRSLTLHLILPVRLFLDAESQEPVKISDSSYFTQVVEEVARPTVLCSHAPSQGHIYCRQNCGDKFVIFELEIARQRPDSLDGAPTLQPGDASLRSSLEDKDEAHHLGATPSTTTPCSNESPGSKKRGPELLSEKEQPPRKAQQTSANATDSATAQRARLADCSRTHACCPLLWAELCSHIDKVPDKIKIVGDAGEEFIAVVRKAHRIIIESEDSAETYNDPFQFADSVGLGAQEGSRNLQCRFLPGRSKLVLGQLRTTWFPLEILLQEQRDTGTPATEDFGGGVGSGPADRPPRRQKLR